MFHVILSLHVLVCVLMILLVLLQSGKGGGFSGIFGGSSGDAVFSAPSGSQFLRKVTTWLAIGFFCTSLSLTYLTAHRSGRSVMQGPLATPPGAPAAPAAAPAAPGAEKPAPAPSDQKK